jgi:hypothetical protein
MPAFSLTTPFAMLLPQISVLDVLPIEQQDSDYVEEGPRPALSVREVRELSLSRRLSQQWPQVLPESCRRQASCA